MAAVTMFTTPWCGYCRRLERALAHHGVEVAKVDIEQQPEFGDRIEELTGGYRTVPTVVVGNKSGEQWLVNPSASEVVEALA